MRILEIPTDLAEFYGSLTQAQFTYVFSQLAALGKGYAELDDRDRLALIRILGREAQRVVQG